MSRRRRRHKIRRPHKFDPKAFLAVVVFLFFVLMVLLVTSVISSQLLGMFSDSSDMDSSVGQILPATNSVIVR